MRCHPRQYPWGLIHTRSCLSYNRLVDFTGPTSTLRPICTSVRFSQIWPLEGDSKQLIHFSSCAPLLASFDGRLSTCRVVLRNPELSETLYSLTAARAFGVDADRLPSFTMRCPCTPKSPWDFCCETHPKFLLRRARAITVIAVLTQHNNSGVQRRAKKSKSVPLSFCYRCRSCERSS